MENQTTSEVPVTVHWQDAPPAASPLGGLFPILLMFAIFYFVLIRPQSKERKAHEAMVAALAARGIPHAYVAFEGEQHGFRRAENVAAALEGELSFYGQVFGFEPDIEGDGIVVRGL